MSENIRVSDIARAICRAATTDLKECPLSREEVALAISRLAGRNVSKSQLDAFVSETHPHRLPLDLVAVWTKVTGSRRLLDLVCVQAGLHVYVHHYGL